MKVFLIQITLIYRLIHKARALMFDPMEYYDKYISDDTLIKRNKLIRKIIFDGLKRY